jgi:hypothetical protein
MTSIFDPSNKVKGNWMAWKNVGDKIEGTLINKRVVNNQLQGKEQIVYELKLANGEIWNVGGKPGIDVQMRYIKLGQVVGFEFVQEKAPSKPGLNATKIIQVYANSSVVDKDWLAQQEDETAASGDEPVTYTESALASTPEDILKRINNIAVEKLGATNAESVKNKVMEATNLAFIESNLPQILATLEELPDKK